MVPKILQAARLDSLKEAGGEGESQTTSMRKKGLHESNSHEQTKVVNGYLI